MVEFLSQTSSRFLVLWLAPNFCPKCRLPMRLYQWLTILVPFFVSTDVKCFIGRCMTVFVIQCWKRNTSSQYIQWNILTMQYCAAIIICTTWNYLYISIHKQFMMWPWQKWCVTFCQGATKNGIHYLERDQMKYNSPWGKVTTLAMVCHCKNWNCN